VVISDIVLDGELPTAIRQALPAYLGCVAGAMQREEYFLAVRDAGLRQVELLKDIDYLELVGDRLPEEAVELVQRSGVDPVDLAGKVRSITFRAVLA
jgi:hypothetical protein